MEARRRRRQGREEKEEDEEEGDEDEENEEKEEEKVEECQVVISNGERYCFCPNYFVASMEKGEEVIKKKEIFGTYLRECKENYDREEKKKIAIHNLRAKKGLGRR
jgi:Zn-finger protein